jgi:hypothetical protein
MPLIYIPLLLMCCGYAFARGGAPERWCAVLFVAGTILTSVIVPSPIGRYQHVEIAVFAVDVCLLCGFVAIALFAQRYWPLWMSSMQLVAVASHSAGLLLSYRLPWAYAVAIAFWSYPMLIMLAWGTARHRGRVRRFKWDPSWVDRPRLAP